MSQDRRVFEPRRIAVVGTSASGKTTFARALAATLGVEHIELDALYWQPGWVKPAEPEFRSIVERETAREHWVADGNYSVVRDIVWGRASDVIWLDYPFTLVFRRALLRTVRRAATREALFAGNRESFRMSFFSRESILLWVIQTYRPNRRMYASLRASEQWRHLRFTVLESRAQTAAYLSRYRNSGPGSISTNRDSDFRDTVR